MNSKRRSNGEGSFWQLPDRTWVYQITVGRKENGSPERKSFKGRTKAICRQRGEVWLAEREAQKKIDAAKRQKQLDEEQRYLALGHYPESEAPFGEAFLGWLKLYKVPPTRKPSTYAGYLNTYNSHFAEYFGDMPLYSVTQDVVQDYYQQKQLSGARKDGKDGGLSPKTIRNHHMILKDFFSYAQKKYRLPANPVLDTTRPEVITPEMRVLSPSEMQVFIEEVMRESQRVAILTALFVGFRVGELLALDIADLDVERQTLTVNKNLIRVSTAALSPENPNIRIIDYNPAKKTHLIVQSTPKTKSSNREIAISDGLCELLIRHLFTLAHSSWPNPNNLLFPSAKGTYLDPRSLAIRLNAVSKRCEIRNVNPHALRHTLATRLVEEKTPLNIVQGILGHSSLETTRKYIHKNEDVEREAIERMSDYLDIEKLASAPQLNGAKKRSKFSGIILPDFSKTHREIPPESA